MGYIYERIASELESAIDKGAYPVGARLPSVREIRDRFGVSVSTAIEAYALLEEKGLVQPKPKSGHFVKLRPLLKDQPSKTSPAVDPRPVSIVEQIMEICWAPAGKVTTSLSVTAPTPAAVCELARSAAKVARLYTPKAIDYVRPEGARPLRVAITRMMVERNCMTGIDDVIVTNGGHEALVLGLRATTRPNDVIAVESPTYFGVLQAIEALSLRVLELPTDPRRGVDLGELEHVVRKRRIRACVLAPTYQNPLGFCMRDEDKKSAVDILCEGGVPLIEDDVFSSITIDTPGPRPTKYFDHSGNVIYCGSFSKTLSPALRIGWILPGRHAKEVLREKFLANLSTALIPQLAVADYLTGNRFRRMTQNAARLYARRLSLLRDCILNTFPSGTKCTAPAGGMILWVELPKEFDSNAILKIARKDGITFFPGNMFSATGAYRNFLRLSVSNVEEDAIPKIARKLSGFVGRSCTMI